MPQYLGLRRPAGRCKKVGFVWVRGVLSAMACLRQLGNSAALGQHARRNSLIHIAFVPDLYDPSSIVGAYCSLPPVGSSFSSTISEQGVRAGLSSFPEPSDCFIELLEFAQLSSRMQVVTLLSQTDIRSITDAGDKIEIENAIESFVQQA